MANDAALVTGASTGIGHAITLLLARSGYTVYAGVRKEADRQRLESEHERIHPVILDVRVPADIARAVQNLREAGDTLVGLVNNAGIAVGGPLEFLPIEALRNQFEINVIAPVAMTQAVLPLLRESRGRIVNIGSIAGRMAAPFIGPYSASKSAIAALTDALRQELAPFGIGVSLLEFASVKTPIWEKGRAGRDALVAAMPPQAMTYYGTLAEAIIAVTNAEEREGMSPQTIANTVLAALRAPKPRERYVIGRKAKIQTVVAMLPARTRDALVKRVMKLP
ncbi:MAG TPA: SDR family oxidoreductase [Candidatus Baltobacteraceae bacterium]|nr:SDR family oxidoreductase [Candidatus Baltobacteraceae bacterium]